MASSDILSQTLSSITAIKLDELSSQRASFEAGKAELLKAVNGEPNQSKKVQILLDRVEDLSSMGRLEDNPLISLKNTRHFLGQAGRDPSVSTKLQQDWQSKLQNELNIHSLKYEYASLYGRLVNEWLAVSVETPESVFEEVGRKEMHEQRALWEQYVFTAKETDTDAIKTYLGKLFNATPAMKAEYDRLIRKTKDFEKQMAEQTDHFDNVSLGWVIKGLLRSDLVSDEKRKVLQDFLNNKVVLAEVADVLNMRMATLKKWKWDPAGTPVEQRRQLNGRYRFYHDEDLLQSILLRYIGTKWSIFFKDALEAFTFTKSPEAWAKSPAPIPESEKRRREYFLGHGTSGTHNSLDRKRGLHYRNDIFLEQLASKVEEQRGGYDSDSEDATDTRQSGQQITQNLLHTLVAEMIMATRLGHEPVVVRSDFKWFGPSLPHSTMFNVLQFMGVSDKWVDFFRQALSAPMKFVQDGPDAPVQIRKRGTPISGPLSDMLGETVLFCLDFAFSQRTGGAFLYRLHDDIWFWGSEQTCVTGWNAMTEFAQVMGLDFNEDKTGSVKVTRKKGHLGQIPASLPKGDVRWGFLKLDSETGRFLIDQESVDTHIEELRRQLGACRSVFDWIQAWNVYGARFFTNNFGKPAQCYSRDHVDMMLDTFARIQEKLFASTGGSVTSTLKQMITERFGVTDIPEGYLYFPSSMGGLDLKNPFVSLYLVRNKICKNPDKKMDEFLAEEKQAYEKAKALFDKGEVPGASFLPYQTTLEFKDQPFLSFEEYTKFRDQISTGFADVWTELKREPAEENINLTADVSGVVGRSNLQWHKADYYQRWIIQLYGPDMIPRFGGLNIVEKGLLPTGMVGMFRESRFKWQG
jgi:hypothetical protein